MAHRKRALGTDQLKNDRFNDLEVLDRGYECSRE